MPVRQEAFAGWRNRCHRRQGYRVGYYRPRKLRKLNEGSPDGRQGSSSAVDGPRAARKALSRDEVESSGYLRVHGHQRLQGGNDREVRRRSGRKLDKVGFCKCLLRRCCEIDHSRSLALSRFDDNRAPGQIAIMPRCAFTGASAKVSLAVPAKPIQRGTK